MFESIQKLLATAKDKALEAAARAFLNQKIAAFGNITALTVDTRLRKASLTAELRGETVPISVEIGSYDLVERNGQTCIRVGEITSNREWLKLAMEHYLVGRLVPLPSNILPLLR